MLMKEKQRFQKTSNFGNLNSGIHICSTHFSADFNREKIIPLIRYGIMHCVLILSSFI